MAPYRVDRRECDRVAFDAEVEVLHGQELLSPARAFDLGEGGLRMDLVTVPTDAKITVFLVVSSVEGQPPKTVMIEGRVAWRRLKASGVRFVGISEADRRLLRSFVQRQSSLLN